MSFRDSMGHVASASEMGSDASGDEYLDATEMPDSEFQAMRDESTQLVVHHVGLDELRAMLARRERLSNLLALLPMSEAEGGEVLTDEIDNLGCQILARQIVDTAKLYAFVSTLPPIEMGVVA